MLIHTAVTSFLQKRFAAYIVLRKIRRNTFRIRRAIVRCRKSYNSLHLVLRNLLGCTEYTHLHLVYCMYHQHKVNKTPDL